MSMKSVLLLTLLAYGFAIVVTYVSARFALAR